MAFVTPLIFNISTGQLVLSVAQPSPLGALTWFLGDTKHLQIQFVQNGATQGTVSVVPATGIGLDLAIGTPGNSALTSASSPPADATNTYTVDLAMTTDALSSAISQGKYQGVLELRTSDGTNYQRYEIPITVLQNLISGTLTNTPAPDTAIGINAANANFVKRNGAPGDFQILTSPDGSTSCRFYWGNDGVPHFDKIS